MPLLFIIVKSYLVNYAKETIGIRILRMKSEEALEIENTSKPITLSKEEKVKEGEVIRKMLKETNMSQKEWAEAIGVAPTYANQWLGKNPIPVPDWAWTRSAYLLEFDPTVTRPWLRDLYFHLHAVLESKLIEIKQEMQVKASTVGVDNIMAAVAKIERDDALKLIGRIEERFEIN